MNLTDLTKNIVRRKRKKRVGRGIGSGHGKTAARGAKGQYSSAGADLPSILFEGGQMPLYRRSPKRGFSNGRHRPKFNVVNVGDLDAVFAPGETVTPDLLAERGLAKKTLDGVRILGNGELTHKLSIRAHYFTASALKKIEACGGTAEKIEPPKPPVRNKMKPRPPKTPTA